MNVEPVVASHSALRQMIPQLYARVEGHAAGAPTVLEVGEGLMPDDGLPMPGFEMEALPVKIPLTSMPAAHAWTPDPFFDPTAPVPSAPTQPLADPFGLFDDAPVPGAGRALMPTPPPGVVQSRTLETSLRKLDTYETRVLALGLVKFLQRRGVLGEGELERFIANLVESGEVKETPGGR